MHVFFPTPTKKFCMKPSHAPPHSGSSSESHLRSERLEVIDLLVDDNPAAVLVLIVVVNVLLAEDTTVGVSHQHPCGGAGGGEQGVTNSNRR